VLRFAVNSTFAPWATPVGEALTVTPVVALVIVKFTAAEVADLKLESPE
jgi:hypothetical protein